MGYKVLSITVPGEPKGKGRPRFSRASGRAYTPEATANYENLIALAFRQKYPDWTPTDKPLQIIMSAYFGIPKSFSKKKRDAALYGGIRPTKKPDTDNIAKMKDALNGIAWVDDSQVVCELVRKWYSDNPRLEIEISLWGEE